MTRYVIIGNSAAAIGCVEGIRQLDKSGDITMISSEGYHTYSRPLISYLLQGKTTEERMKYRPDDFYDKNNCRLLLNKTVVKIDNAENEVRLNDGSVIHYDKLMVATGSSPFVPPMEGLDTVEKRFTFLSLDDARALEAALTPESRVLIVGAGLIGLKCAEGIRHRVRSLTVVDLADRVLPSVLDAQGAAMVQIHLEEQGIHFFLNDSVERFESGCVHLKSGTSVGFDILVLAVGVRPNTALVREAGGAVNRGILIDEYGRTSLPNMYAAGDCTECLDISSGENRIMALLPNAYRQGECAGIHMASGGELPEMRAIPMNAVGFFGLHILTAGSYTGDDYVERDDRHYKRLFYADNCLKGFILIGDVERAGIYTALIRDQTPLDTIDFDLIREKPQLMAFSRRERKKMLSGAAG